MDTLSAMSLTELLNQVWHCKAEDLLAALPDNSIDLIVTSPPYDNLRIYKGFEWDFATIAQGSYRVLKESGVLVWVVGDATINGSETLSSMRQALYFVDECGFKMHDTMIYQKDGNPFPESNRYQNEFEYMFVLSKGKPNTFNGLRDKTRYGGSSTSTTRSANGRIRNFAYAFGKETKLIGNVWRIVGGFMKSTMDTIAFSHPATYPEELAYRHIYSWSNEGDIVLDYFMGSGTTAKMARNLNRHYIGCDISEEYVTLARTRLANTDPFQHSTLPDGSKQLSLFADKD